MLESVNIIISLFCVILVYKIAWLLSNCDFRSKQSAAIFAFFPSIILYNIIILREVYIVLLILLFALYMLKWLKSKQIKFAIIAIILYIPMYFLHGGLIIGAVMFFIILVIASINDIISTLNKNRLLVPQLQFIFFCMFFLIFVFVRIDNLNIPYFGNTDQILNISKILYFAEVTNLGGSAYPSWLIPSSLSNFVLLIFPRLIYFLFSPFLWDIKAINHLLGFVDALLVITLFFFIIKGMLVKKPGKYVTILCIILLPLLITYSWGVGNFGTALRHRSKFIPVFIAISSIYVPIVKLRKNLKVYKPDE
jgi:hypothetical protein